MKKILLLLACSLLTVLSALAVPAKRILRTVDQGDGTTLSVTLVGDEHFHCFATTDGQPLIELSNGTMAYAQLNNGSLVSTGILAHEPALRTEEETAFLNENSTLILQQIAELRAQRLAIANSAITKANAKRKAAAQKTSSTYTGSKRGIVILVSYSDKAMTATQSQLDSQFNTEGYSTNGHIGSVHDYFYDQSYGKLDWTFDVVGPYTLSNTLAYYGKNDNSGNDQYLGQMIAEACQLADDDVDFSQYDWDGDGEVDQVFVIYAGYGENAGAASNTIWPCMWELASSDYGSSLTLDGVTVNTFACSCELAGTSGSTLDGIGVACHEFSHCLGLPDLYDTGNLLNNFGMATWSILDSGNYLGPNGNGEVPCAYTGYERMFVGWLDPIVLSEGTAVDEMKPITDGDPEDVFILYNDADSDEFYILENRQLESWDSYGYGHGMLVIHVNYVEAYWNANTVNNYSNQCCTIIPADDDQTYTTTSLAKDPYPGTTGNTELTDSSTPAAILYNANTDGTYYMGKPITDIAESDEGNISFVFNNGISTPIPLEATDISTGTFTANWEAVSNAESYNVKLYEVTDAEASLVLSEDFSGLTSLTNQGTNIGSVLDNYLSTSGWTGYKLFTGYYYSDFYGIKLGSTSYNGWLLTPTLDAPATGSVTVYFQTALFPSDTTMELIVTILDASGSTLATATYTAAGSYVLMATDVTTDYQVKFATTDDNKRAYLSYIAIYDGEYSLSDIEESLESSSAPRRASAVSTVTGITTTNYTFTGLTGNQYYYYVQAVVGSYSSEWSEGIYVDLTASGIEQVLAVSSEETFNVYNLSGILLRRANAENWSDGLPRGTYILQSGKQAIKVSF